MTKQLSRITVVAGALGALLAGTAGPAGAAENIRESLSFEPEVVAVCADGAEIGLGFDLTRNRHLTHRDGVLVREVRNVAYTGYFVVLGTDERYTFQGTRIITFDHEAGTFTSRGNYRTVTRPGEGTVFHTAGRYVEDLDVEGLFLHESGPRFDEWSPGGDAVSCGLFGRQAAG